MFFFNWVFTSFFYCPYKNERGCVLDVFKHISILCSSDDCRKKIQKVQKSYKNVRTYVTDVVGEFLPLANVLFK